MSSSASVGGSAGSSRSGPRIPDRVVPPVPNAAAGRNLASSSGRGIGSEPLQSQRSPVPARLCTPDMKGCRYDEIPSPEPTLALLRSGARPLVVGGVSEFTPFNVVGPDGQLTGMDREIVRAAAKRLGIKQVEFKTMAFSKLGQSLLDGKIDLIANNYWPTPDRERLYAFTMPYFTRGGVGSLWIEGTGPFDSAASMAGRRIATFKGSYPEAWTQEHVPTATILPVDGTSAELDDTLQTGRADVVVGFYTRQRGVSLKQERGRGYKNALLQPMRAAFAVRKDSKELREALDGVLKEMWADGSLNKIKRVYLDPLEIEPSPSP